jgi:hypothetical protein
LKIRVSVVQFHPWPLFSSTSIAVALLAELMLRRGSASARAQRGHPPDQALEGRSVFFRECLLERLDQHVRVLRLERQRRANLEDIAVAAG